MVIRENTLKLADAVKTKLLESPGARRFLRSNLATSLKTRFLELAYLSVVFVMTAGLVNSMLESFKPQYSGMLYVPGRGAQTLNEVVFNFFDLVLGTAGIYMIYVGARASPRGRLSGLYMVFGFSAVIVAVLVAIYLIWMKRF